MVKISRKGILLYYACMLILVIGLLGNRHRDYLEKEYYNYPDYPELNNISVNEEYRTAWDAEMPYAGVVTLGPDISLPKGSYEIEFRYRSEREDNRFEVVSDWEVNSQNGQGVVYAEHALPLNEDGRYTAVVELQKDAEHIQIKTYTEKGDLYLYGYTLRSTQPVNQDTWVNVVAVTALFLLFHLCCLKRMDAGDKIGALIQMEDADKFGVVLAVVLIGVVASLPCFTDFVTSGHDLDYHLTRIEGLKEALACGQFPVRVNPEFANGAGMVNPVMYPELFLYFPAILRLLGGSLILSYHYFVMSMNLACAWAGYVAFEKLTGKRILGVLMSAFYTLSLYRMNNLYMRAAVGEWTGMIFLPLVLYGMYALFYEKYENWGFSVLAFTLCLQGHLLTTEMAIGFSVLFALFSWRQLKERKRLFTVCKAGMVTLLVNLWYVAPFLYFYRQSLGVTAERQPLGQYSLYLSQLFTTFLYNRNMGEFLGKTAEEMPSTIGGILGIGVLLYLYAAYVKQNLSKRERNIGNILLGFGLFSLYMTTYYFPWDLIQKVHLFDVLAGILQFPIRILAVATLFLAGVCSLGFYGVCKDRLSGRGIALLGVILAILCSSYTLDQYTEQNKTELMDETDAFQKNLIYNGLLYYQGTDSAALLNRSPIILTDSENIVIRDLTRKGTTLEFSYENRDENECALELPLYYYPGYHVFENGEEREIKSGNNGMATIWISGNAEGQIRVLYREKWIFLVCDGVTLVTLAVCAVLAVRKRKKCKR